MVLIFTPETQKEDQVKRLLEKIVFHHLDVTSECKVQTALCVLQLYTWRALASMQTLLGRSYNLDFQKPKTMPAIQPDSMQKTLA